MDMHTALGSSRPRHGRPCVSRASKSFASPHGYLAAIARDDFDGAPKVDYEYRLYSRKINPKTGKRRDLGTFKSRAAAEKHERDVQYFKRH